MAIFSDDVDNVRIIGTILIFVFSIIGAGVPIAVARTWGAAQAPSTDVSDKSKAEARRVRREEAKAHQRRQTTLKFIQHMFLALGAGVIVATAIMHMLPEGTEAVTEGYEGLQGIEHSHDHGSHDDHDHDDHDHDHDHNDTTTDHDHDHDHNETDHNDTDHDHDHDHNETTTAGPDDHIHDEEAEAEEGGHAHGFPYGYLFVLAGLIIMFIVESEMHRLLEAYDHHEPAAVSKEKAAAVTIDGGAAEAQYQRELAAARTHSAKAKLLEIAVATHSIIIGVAFGALTNAHSSNPLALALMFHQLCEGFAVGAVFERAFRAAPVRPTVQKSQDPVSAEPEEESSFWARNGRHIGLAVFVLLFAFSVPVGIFIGIGVAEGGSDPDAPGSLFARGALECFAGGVLLYVGCVEFLGGLFGSHQHSHVSTDNDCESDDEQAAVADGSESDVGAVKGIVVRDEEEHGHSHAHGHSHHSHAAERHLLQTDTLFGRICTYLLVIVGAGSMSVIAKWA